MTYQIRILPDAAAIAAEAATLFLAQADQAIGHDGSFSVALSGGSTPKMLYQLLAAEPRRAQIKWPAVEIFFGDERCVPPDHADSNYRMARLALLQSVPLEEKHIHRMRGEIEPEAAATEYGQLLKARFNDGGLDLVLLGMGDDGHTASLFPGTAALAETRHRCVANRVDKLNTWRLTLSAPFINRARNIIVLVSGAAKAQRLREVLEGPRDPNRLPIQFVQPAGGQMTWLVDAAAAAELRNNKGIS